MAERPPTPQFSIVYDEEQPTDVLLAGFSQFGLAGLTAVDYLVDTLGLKTEGHITSEEFPSITPFENGTPRHHTRFFGHPDVPVTILSGELFIPLWASRSLSTEILQWTNTTGIEEIAILSGIPVAHGPDDHRTFYIATEDFQQRRLEDDEVPPMGRGFLDGVNAELIEQGIDSPLAVGVFVTPVHQQIPDIEAAIRLVSTISDLYNLDVDTHPLETFAEEIQSYYSELAERVEAAKDSEIPEDRMYM